MLRVKQQSNGIVILSIKTVIVATSATMLVSFFLSIWLAMVYNYESAIGTHCKVANYLPSVSAAISIEPSCYVWRIAIALCSPTRLALAFMHFMYFYNYSRANARYKFLCILCIFFEVLENLSLIGLTYISSRELKEVHEMLFLVFQASSMLFMLCICVMYKKYIKYSDSENIISEKRTLYSKMSVFALDILSCLIAVYFFLRHNRYCEAGVYTMFALCEYVVVVSNIIFHSLVTYHFADRDVRVGCTKDILTHYD
ncbi:post-GPI attachment to proteins factor 2-like [Antedon mediterranea]|uniref:post-GPI attachment to proteins factor 2-like n=1 Tax=Antedon mediterranea TaxID=105859 RepID=UPI003AF6BA34